MIWCRNASDSNEQHDVEINSARTAVEEEVAKDSEDALRHVESEFLAAIVILEVLCSLLGVLKKNNTILILS